MTNLIHKTGDLFTTHARGIGHGVNIDGVMGHGIAVAFKDRFPQMHGEYVVRCYAGQLLPGTVFIYEAMPGYFIYNIASQDRPGKNARYEWLAAGVRSALKHADDNGLPSIALPRIGSGIGGLDQAQVEEILTSVVAEYKADLELWTLPR